MLHGEIRSHSRALLDGHIAHLNEACRKAEERFGGRAVPTIIPEHDALSVAPDHPLLAVVREAAAVCALPFFTFATGGGSDANILAARGIACVNLACGMYNVHTNEEFVLISDMEKICALLVSILTDKCAGLA
jgi:tripeptide aminopeptidase